jgi:serine/threonine-protein kinase
VAPSETIAEEEGPGEAPNEEDANVATSSEAAADTRPEPALPKPARLTVIVFPWGEIWINGKLQGQAPLKDHALKAGRYQISAGQGTPVQTQTVRLRPGQRQNLSFDLTRPEPKP